MKYLRNILPELLHAIAFSEGTMMISFDLRTPLPFSISFVSSPSRWSLVQDSEILKTVRIVRVLVLATARVNSLSAVDVWGGIWLLVVTTRSLSI